VALIEHTPIQLVPGLREAPLDERAARRTLRGQIARLERELSDAVVAAFPHVSVAAEPVPHSGPRLLSLGELEAVRDDLAERVRRARVVVAERGEREAAARALLERMLVEPERHRWVRLPASELGERGCGAYQVRPRLGLVGMLMGWWQVKLSSGCPLAGAGCAGAPGRTRRIPGDGPPQPQARDD
jgi:hypothetical protein